MKTLKNTFLLLMALATFSQAKAHCPFFIGATPNGPDVQFYAYIDSASLPATWYWEFGDGDTSTEISPVHTYSTSGTYNYCFHYFSASCTEDTCNPVNVNVCAFNPQITYTNTNQLTSTLGVNNAPPGSTYSWFINNGGGSVITSTLANPVVTYPNWATNYLAYVIVTAPGGCVDTTSTDVYLSNPCHPSWNEYVVGATELQFYCSPVDSIHPGTYTYAWTFGDGSTSNIAAPTHDYGALGNWDVCLAVTTSYCTDTICGSVAVTPPPPPIHNLSGTINNGASPACGATIYLIKEDTAGHLVQISTTYILPDSFNCAGHYNFYNVDEGVYYVKAALIFGNVQNDNYLPTYYGDVLNWGAATAVNLNNNLTGIDINLIAGVNPGGPGFVGGWVSQGAGLAIGGSNIGRALGDPLPDIQINLLTVNDVPVASTKTDANGRYTFSNLALGTYKLYAEEINKVPTPQNVTLTANNPSQDNVDVSINSTSAVTGIDDLRDIHLEGVFPNPVTDKATVEISLKENSKLRMTLTDVNGRLIQNRNLELTTGTNEIRLDMSNEPAGVYHLSLINDTSKKIVRLVKIK